MTRGRKAPFTILMVGVTAVLAVALGLYAFRPATKAADAPTPPPNTAAHIITIDRTRSHPIPNGLPALTVDESSLGRQLGPQDVLATDSGVWVVAFQELVLLDGSSGEMARSLPFRGEDGSRLAATGSGVWVFDGSEGLFTVSGADLEEIATVRLEDMVGTDKILWVSGDDRSVGQLDASSGTVVSSVPGGLSGDISTGAGGAWVSGDLIQGDSIFVGADGGITTQIRGASHAVEAAGYTWVISYEAPYDRDEAAVIAVVDTATGETVTTFAVPRAVSLATDGEDVWVYALAPSTKKGTWTPDPDVPGQIIRIDGVSLKPVGAVGWGLGPVQMSVRDGEVWLADQSTGAVARVTS